MQQDVSAYYNQTQNHYRRWWKLNKGMSLHYGLWYKDTRNFVEALRNTNKYMAEKAEVASDHIILDAGCGVGDRSLTCPLLLLCSWTLAERKRAHA